MPLSDCLVPSVDTRSRSSKIKLLSSDSTVFAMTSGLKRTNNQRDVTGYVYAWKQVDLLLNRLN